MKGSGANPYTLVPCSSGLAIDILIDFRVPPACPDGLPNRLGSLDASSLAALPGDPTSTHSKQLSLRCPSKLVFGRIGDPGMELPCAGKLASLIKLFF